MKKRHICTILGAGVIMIATMSSTVVQAEGEPVTVSWAVFETDNPNIKIEKVLMTGDSRPQFLKTMLSAGNMPDGYIVTNNGSKNLIPTYTALRSQVYYNKQQFEEAGITEVPKTWDEFTAACDKLTEAGFTPLMGVGAADSWATGVGYWSGVVNAEVEAAYPEFNKQVLAG